MPVDPSSPAASVYLALFSQYTAADPSTRDDIPLGHLKQHALAELVDASNGLTCSYAVSRHNRNNAGAGRCGRPAERFDLGLPDERFLCCEHRAFVLWKRVERAARWEWAELVRCDRA